MLEDDRPQRTRASHTIVLGVSRRTEGRVLVSFLGKDMLDVFHCLCQFTQSPLKASILSINYILDKEGGQAAIVCDQLLLSFSRSSASSVPETAEGQPGCGTSDSHTSAMIGHPPSCPAPQGAPAHGAWLF